MTGAAVQRRTQTDADGRTPTARPAQPPTALSREGRLTRPSAAELIALQRTAGNRAVARLLGSGPGSPRQARIRPLQREVRIDGGKKKVDENYYKNGEGFFIGLRFLIADLINDPVRRVFRDAAELEDYALGLTDYIGDVKTNKSGTFWLRVPKDQLTVIGESHDSDDGNFEDVILAFDTGRFKYEPYHDAPSAIPLTGTTAQLDKTVDQYRATHLDPGKYQLNFDPTKFGDKSLENIVIKSYFSVSTVLKDFIGASKKQREDAQWKQRPSNRDYSWGERQALYFSIAIHVAADLAKNNFGPVDPKESPLTKSERKLTETYLAQQKELDAFMKAKDGDELIAMYELTAPGGFANLPALAAFGWAYQRYAVQYAADLGKSSGNKDLVNAIAKGPTWDALNAAREAIIWKKVQEAKASGYLLVGMGDAHHRSLTKKLDGAGIPHFFVEDELIRQRDEINKAWVP